jgi:hypothetical protein
LAGEEEEEEENVKNDMSYSQINMDHSFIKAIRVTSPPSFISKLSTSTQARPQTFKDLFSYFLRKK